MRKYYSNEYRQIAPDRARKKNVNYDYEQRKSKTNHRIDRKKFAYEIYFGNQISWLLFFLLLSFEITKEMCDRFQRSKANALIKSRKETDKHLNSMVQVSNDYCVFCVSFSSLVLLSLSCIQNNLFRQHANFVQTLQIFVGQNKVKKIIYKTRSTRIWAS